MKEKNGLNIFLNFSTLKKSEGQNVALNFLHELFDISKKYYKVIFSATNYKQYFSFRGKVINRRHIETFWPKSHIRYFL